MLAHLPFGKTPGPKGSRIASAMALGALALLIGACVNQDRGGIAGLARPDAGIAGRGGPLTASADPLPIPGGFVPFEGAPLLHGWIPGPTSLPNRMGLDVDPSTITNFNGFTALGYLGGSATDDSGASHDLDIDLRAYQGLYVTGDGRHLHGTFAFV